MTAEGVERDSVNVLFAAADGPPDKADVLVPVTE